VFYITLGDCFAQVFEGKIRSVCTVFIMTLTMFVEHVLITSHFCNKLAQFIAGYSNSCAASGGALPVGWVELVSFGEEWADPSDVWFFCHFRPR